MLARKSYRVGHGISKSRKKEFMKCKTYDGGTKARCNTSEAKGDMNEIFKAGLPANVLESNLLGAVIVAGILNRVEDV
jgi:hypothetical protein